MEQTGLIRTGVTEIDDIIEGMYPSELISLAAIPGGGKTSLLCEMAKNVSKENNALFFFLADEQRTFTR